MGLVSVSAAVTVYATVSVSEADPASVSPPAPVSSTLRNPNQTPGAVAAMPGTFKSLFQFGMQIQTPFPESEPDPGSSSIATEVEGGIGYRG
jgi:hypothetical protein